MQWYRRSAEQNDPAWAVPLTARLDAREAPARLAVRFTLAKAKRLRGVDLEHEGHMLLAAVLVDESAVTHIEVPRSTVFRLVGSSDPSEFRLVAHTYGITLDHEVEAFGQ